MLFWWPHRRIEHLFMGEYKPKIKFAFLSQDRNDTSLNVVNHSKRNTRLTDTTQVLQLISHSFSLRFMFLKGEIMALPFEWLKIIIMLSSYSFEKPNLGLLKLVWFETFLFSLQFISIINFTKQKKIKMNDNVLEVESGYTTKHERF